MTRESPAEPYRAQIAARCILYHCSLYHRPRDSAPRPSAQLLGKVSLQLAAPHDQTERIR